MDAEHQLGGWWRSAMLSLFVAGLGTFFWQAATPTAFEEFSKEFTAAYAAMDPDPFVLELRDRLQAIPDDSTLHEQERFFSEQHIRLQRFNVKALPFEQREQARLIGYIIDRNKQRLALELEWVQAKRPFPLNGLSDLPSQARWYEWLVKRYTSTDITPKEVKDLGEREIDRCHRELSSLALALGFPDDALFQQHLASEEFIIRNKEELLEEFSHIDSITRSRLSQFVRTIDVPPVHPMEWPDAGKNTPPGMYLPREHNAYNADVFQFNFHDGTFNSRALSWIYLHEAIPGHHLQFSIRRNLKINDLRAYLRESGNFEGWACYVEYHGDQLGIYDDPWRSVGKWEWDLVRSVRLVLDVGIHYEGWSRDQALAFWKENISGQDAIAEREVDRVTAMPGQVLSYKVGAEKIQKIAEKVKAESDGEIDLIEFHQAFLNAGELPLALMEEHIMHELGVG